MTGRSENIAWPQKKRELYHNHFDSTIWNDFPFRNDDIIIGTYAKSGTTWLQQIISQLIFKGSEGIMVPEISPWLDMTLPPKEAKLAELEAQTHRRFVKTHLPVDALEYSPKAKYVYIARDGRDVLWSLYNHHSKMTPEFLGILNEMRPEGTDEFLAPTLEIRDYYLRWLEGDGEPYWSFWENIASWWAIRGLPNMLLLHYGALKDDMPGEIKRIAEFLEIDIEDATWEQILEHCSFDYMKKNAEHSVPLGGAPWEGGAKTFINKGTNGRWRDILTDEDIQRYEQLAIDRLGPECAQWLATGKVPAA